MNLWPKNIIKQVPLNGGGEAFDIPSGFMPDNIHRIDDGRFVIGGHIATPQILFGCKREHCLVDWAVAILDPETHAIDYLRWDKGVSTFEGITGATQVGDELWLATYYGDRIAIMPLPPRN